MSTSAVDSAPYVANTLVVAVDCTYLGFSLRETTGAAVATVRIRAGSVTGKILDTVQLVASESDREWYGGAGPFAGLRARGGIFIETVAGTVEGAVRYQ